jgi:hypothetical protein
MARLLFVRIAGGLGLTSLALFFVGVMPFLSADPTAGAGLIGKAAGFSVNREFKGDRLPMLDGNSVALRTPRRPEKIPYGCDASFSPISAPRLAYIYGRCTT